MAKNYNVQELREKIAETITQFDYAQLFLLPEKQENIINHEEWLDSITQDGIWCDAIFIHLAATFLKKKIIMLPIYAEDGHGESGEIVVDPGKTIGSPLHMLYYKDMHFHSIIPIGKP